MLRDEAICDGAASAMELPSDAVEGPRHRWYIVVKTVGEWLGALILFLLLAPLIGLLGLIVKVTSPGPAFYTQVRLGRYGKPFRIYKLRSMSHNCEAQTGAVWSSGQADPRVTRFGRFLRDTHLDELPQLWNVLQGQMSLIGPRPERPEIAATIERAIPRYQHRLMVLPGVTGLAQVQLPPDTDLECVRRKLAYDLHYVREVNLVLDAKILVATFFQFLASGIYALGRGMVKSERVMVESRNFEGLKIVAADAWRVGAA